MLGLRAETFEGTFPFRPHYAHVNGFQMHFVDEGQGEPVVFVHGDPTWGYVYRRLIPALARRYRCIVPDHMGMGKSEVPAEPYPYRLHHHIANLETLLLGLDVRGITLVVHDWGGPVGLGFAIRHPERIKRLVLMNTWAFAPWPAGPLPRLLEIIRSPRGERFVLEKNGYVEAALRGTTHYADGLTKVVMDAYLAPFPSPDSRRALLCWSRDIPVNEGDPSYPEMKGIENALSLFGDIPVLVVWGTRDPVLTEPVLRRWREIYPHAAIRAIPDASHFLQEDAPEAVLREVEEFVDTKG